MNDRKKDEEVSRTIPAFFNAQKIGGSLREIDVSLVQAEHDQVISRWFHGPHDADLFIWMDERRNVIKQQVAFCGQIVEWNVLDGIRTGVVVEQEIQGTQMNASETIQFDSAPQESAVRLALALIHHVNSLDDLTRGELVGQLTDRPSFFTMAPEEILRRYGAGPTDKIWNRFKFLFKMLFKK